MPELPEVETIRRGLEKHLKGLTLKRVDVLLAKQFQGNPKEIEKERVVGVRRRGKITVIDFTGGKSLMIHLKLTGQLVFQKGKETFAGGHPIPFAGKTLPAKATHVVFHFTDGSTLFFNDIRQFGWIKVIDNSQLRRGLAGQGLKELGNLGPEPFTPEFTPEYLEEVFAKTSRPVKLVLMDQEKIAGVGNIYANDALFEAGIDPRRPAKELSSGEISKLFNSIEKVLSDGLKYGGSSAADEAYVNSEGNPGKYQEHFRVYQRQGQPCPNKCGAKIQRVELGGRGTFFCPKCQK